MEMKIIFLEKFQTGVHHIFVVEDACLFCNFFQCCVYSQCRPVGPVGGHGFNDIGDSKDAGLDHCRVSRETPGIPGTVYSFVVLVDYL